MNHRYTRRLKQEIKHNHISSSKIEHSYIASSHVLRDIGSSTYWEIFTTVQFSQFLALAKIFSYTITICLLNHSENDISGTIFRIYRLNNKIYIGTERITLKIIQANYLLASLLINLHAWRTCECIFSQISTGQTRTRCRWWSLRKPLWIVIWRLWNRWTQNL